MFRSNTAFLAICSQHSPINSNTWLRLTKSQYTAATACTDRCCAYQLSTSTTIFAALSRRGAGSTSHTSHVRGYAICEKAFFSSTEEKHSGTRGTHLESKIKMLSKSAALCKTSLQPPEREQPRRISLPAHAQCPCSCQHHTPCERAREAWPETTSDAPDILHFPCSCSQYHAN
jgi:hypothetical protein